MRWTKVLMLVSALGLLIYIVLFYSPMVAPVLAHHSSSLLAALLLTPQSQQRVTTFMLVVMAWAGGVLLLVSVDQNMRKRRTHGSAQVAGRGEVRKYRVARPTRPLFPGWKRGLRLFVKRPHQQAFCLRLGRYLGREIVLNEAEQYEHVLLTGPTGKGKSARVFIPNLLRETGTRSLFIADLKNELYKICAGWLAQHMQVWLFAPLKPTISSGYNPLAHIHGVEDAQDFAETWVANTGGAGGQDGEFWINNTKLLITAMTLHVLKTEQAPALSRLTDLLTTSSFEEISDLLTRTPSVEARRLARQFLENMSKNERLVGAVMTDLGNRFQLLASPAVRATTATNEIDFEEMIDTPTAFFLSLPKKAMRSGRYRPLLAVLTQQMFAAWEERGTAGMAAYLDEFANIGHIPGFAGFISTARSLKVSLLLAIQNFSQLDERYGKDDANTIKANAVTHLLLPGAGLEECRYYSERIGDTTVATTTVNRRGSGLGAEVTFSEGEARRRLMTPDEIRRMRPDQMLMLEAASAPLILTTRLYLHEKKLMERANLPYHVSRVRVTPSPQSPPPPPLGLPAGRQAGAGQQPPPVDDDDEDDEDLFQP